MREPSSLHLSYIRTSHVHEAQKDDRSSGTIIRPHQSIYARYQHLHLQRPVFNTDTHFSNKNKSFTGVTNKGWHHLWKEAGRQKAEQVPSPGLFAAGFLHLSWRYIDHWTECLCSLAQNHYHLLRHFSFRSTFSLSLLARLLVALKDGSVRRSKSHHKPRRSREDAQRSVLGGWEGHWAHLGRRRGCGRWKGDFRSCLSQGSEDCMQAACLLI